MDRFEKIQLSLLFVLFLSGIVFGAIPASERAALISLYNSTNGDNWTDNSGWKTAPLDADGFAMPGTEDGWNGVYPESEHVAYLYLYYNNLTGSIPTELGELNSLIELDLFGNLLTGSIPSGIGNLNNLEWMDLGDNLLTGSIPPELGNLNKLIYLWLYENQLSGSIPPELGNLSSLEWMELDNNLLSGSIPPELGNLNSLYYLELYENQLSGSIPPELGNMSNLEWMDLDSNLLTGSIPPELGNLSNLTYLELYYNQLSGNIPPELGNLSNLACLDLDGNKLTGNIPPELGNLGSLTSLWLCSNQLSGSIPPELGNLSSLKVLWLSSNQLSGSIPPEIANLSALTNLQLDYNSLFSNNSILITFLNTKDADWADTQTISPDGISAITISSSSVNLTWTPIIYTGDTGGYMVYYSTSSGGTFIYSGITADKSAASYLVDGLNHSTTYYFKIKTRTDSHVYNQSTLKSYYSSKASAVTAATVSTTVTTSPISNITDTSASSGGNIISEGTSSITSRGVCWSIMASPAISDSITSNGTGTGSFTSSLTGLRAGTKYYLRAYATDSSGTSYGNELSFRTTEINTQPPSISLSRTQLNFGAVNSIVTKSQDFIVSNSGGGNLNWSTTINNSWLSCSPTSGTGTNTITVSIDPTGLSTGNFSGTLIIADSNATNSPQSVNINLAVKETESTDGPFGSFDSPIDNSTVMSSIPVTGWALDDIEVEHVKIYRDPISGEGTNLIYIGDAIFVEGARPDVETMYPDYPLNYRAGWGYMLLTNFLPNKGNGTFTLSAIAIDKEGITALLGTKTIICDNANAVKPFGAIDTPVPGSTASGAYRNQGWALTPMPNNIPIDGSTIKVFIDGVYVDNPKYNVYRQDIAAYFPGYANSNGALAYFDFDTTAYSNGTHTIQWSAMDSAGNVDGIGSRYFMITNTSSDKKVKVKGKRLNVEGLNDLSDYEINYEPIEFIKGFSTSRLTAHDSRLKITELEWIVININLNCDKTSYSGYLKVNNQLRSLPIGSSIKDGKFYWSPGPGFIGVYELIFIDHINKTRQNIKVIIKPKYEKIIEELDIK